MTWNAVFLLSSERGIFPLAQVWCVHSGELSNRSMGPVSLSVFLGSTWRRSSLKTVAWGKLALKASVAIFQRSTPPAMLAPANLAPRLLPPPPQNMSNALTVLILQPIVSLFLWSLRKELLLLNCLTGYQATRFPKLLQDTSRSRAIAEV